MHTFVDFKRYYTKTEDLFLQKFWGKNWINPRLQPSRSPGVKTEKMSAPLIFVDRILVFAEGLAKMVASVVF